MVSRPTMAAVRELAGWKEPCYLATTANIDLATGGLLTIDSVVTTAGDRVLVKNQTDASENGIYLASAGEWYRAPDAMSSRNIDKGVLVWVQAGTVNASAIYAFNTLNPDIGTDDINLLLMDFGGLSVGIGDAPSNGNQYVRQDGAWVILDYATAADVRAAASGLNVITSDLMEGASALVALTDAASIALDWDTGINFSVTLGGNRTLANPTNGQPGTWRHIAVTQDGTGSRTLAFGDQYKFEDGTAPTLSTAAASVDMLAVWCVSSTNFFVFAALGMSAGA